MNKYDFWMKVIAIVVILSMLAGVGYTLVYYLLR